ncbi:hypothetical protein Tco_1311191 [Tanacetum coccineum]
MVISSPCLIDNKELTSPEQTAPGKDFSNPLIVDSLLKTIWSSMHHVFTIKHWSVQSKWLLSVKPYIYVDLGVMELENSQNNALAKLPMLKLGEYEMWEIRIKQYFQIQDYALWEVIENGNSWVPIPVTAT